MENEISFFFLMYVRMADESLRQELVGEQTRFDFTSKQRLERLSTFRDGEQYEEDENVDNLEKKRRTTKNRIKEKPRLVSPTL